jgi:hypothetical protein
MIHYHGGPVTPREAALSAWTRRHAMVSFFNPDPVALAAEICQSFALDNGAFSAWTAGKGEVDVAAYCDWVRGWELHPAFDWALIPDKIDGTEADNDRLISQWFAQRLRRPGVPVWHLHEDLGRLRYLSNAYDRIAFGSSGAYMDIGTEAWWNRMGEAMTVVCDDEGRPRCRLHGLRMLNPTVFSQLPLSSADSTNVARSIGMDHAWSKGPYAPMTKSTRAMVLAERIELHASAARWTNTRAQQFNLELIG